MILSITYPKSGSHLIGYALGLGTTPTWHRSSTNNFEEFRTEAEYLDIVKNFPHPKGLWTHLPYSKQALKVVMTKYKRICFTRRDPRDIVVSIGHYVDRFPRANLNYFREGKQLHEWDWDSRMKFLIETISIEMPKFLGWAKHPEVFQARYEDLIDDRIAVLKKINEFLQKGGVEPLNIEQAADQSQRKHRLSYRRAKYGDWKYEFAPEVTVYARERLTPLMGELGYAW